MNRKSGARIGKNQRASLGFGAPSPLSFNRVPLAGSVDGFRWISARPASPHPIDQMTRIQRPPIEANIGAETARLGVPLRTIVAVLAQALKRAKPKLVNVAAMWFEMIADRRWRDDGALRAILTKRVFEQLVLPDPGPASRGVPLIPLRRLATSAHRTQPFQCLTGSPPITRVALGRDTRC
jgi:hypothetical protein